MNVKILFLSLFFYGFVVTAQQKEDSEPFGQAYGTVYTYFNSSLNSNYTAFEVSRAYFGYKHKISEEFSANIKLDIGSINDESEYALIRRYSYFKNAFLAYKKNKLTINIGLIDLLQFKTQEKFWDYRYVYKSFQDESRLGSSADIGISATYKFNKIFTADLTLMNGEGYKDFQSDNSFKFAAGLLLTPIKELTARLYYDYSEKQVIQSTYSGFLGYDFKKKFKLGVEYSTQTNNKFYENQNFGGYSGFLMTKINDKIACFFRYDRLKSNKVNATDQNNWNFKKDGQLFLGGIQYKLHEKVRTALNMQIYQSDDENEEHSEYLFINLEFNF
ncbi:MAG: hypothetical protein JXR58_01715 [Bacteroidales bacterium]|nr:hypothetical protein [Bacteroidales bacterium]